MNVPKQREGQKSKCFSAWMWPLLLEELKGKHCILECSEGRKAGGIPICKCLTKAQERWSTPRLEKLCPTCGSHVDWFLPLWSTSSQVEWVWPLLEKEAGRKRVWGPSSWSRGCLCVCGVWLVVFLVVCFFFFFLFCFSHWGKICKQLPWGHTGCSQLDQDLKPTLLNLWLASCPPDILSSFSFLMPWGRSLTRSENHDLLFSWYSHHTFTKGRFWLVWLACLRTAKNPWKT